MVSTLGWITLLAPIAAAVLITTLTLRSRGLSALLAVGSMVAGLTCSTILFLQLKAHALHLPIDASVTWLAAKHLVIRMGVLLDPLSIVMLMVVTIVGLCVFVFSTGYMRDDQSYPRYFAGLAFFAFSMLGIVLATDLIQLFVFWELVGFSSYLLIGFWYEKPSAVEAGKKAFLVNRVADFGFLLGILMLWGLSGHTGAGRTFSFLGLERAVESGLLPEAGLVVAALLIFCGVVGKSAQFPLHVWLPDAMEGPTPVSALMHAATMVAAGVYLLCRMFFLFAPFEAALHVVAYIGGFTACFAALQAIAQNDIKRILAFSTLSQLGYMVMALGLGGYTAGMYHLTTHAFFKALLFLGAGSAIHAVHSQDIWDMGGLRRPMPITTWTFTIGTLALCGFWPFSGFWSKDEILTLAAEHNVLLYLVGTFTAGLTAFYMGRLLFTAFFGKPRRRDGRQLHVTGGAGGEAPTARPQAPSRPLRGPGAEDGRRGPAGDRTRHMGSPHESSLSMTLPLMALAALSVAAGWIGLPHLLHHHLGAHVEFNTTIAVISNIVAAVGLGAAFLVYGWGASIETLLRRLGWAHTLLKNKFYIDEFYLLIVRYVQQSAAILCSLIETYVIVGGFVNGTAAFTRWSGRVLRLFQTGKIQTYALIMTTGLTLLLYAFILRGGRP